MRNERILKMVWAVKMHGFHGNHSGFENGGMPKSNHISAVTYPRQLNLIPNQSLDIGLLTRLG